MFWRYNTVRITHVPTGETVVVDKSRSYTKNTETAMRVMRSRLWAVQNGYPRPDLDRVVAHYELPDDTPFPHELGDFKEKQFDTSE